MRIATLVLLLALGAPLMGEGAQTIRVAIVEQARTVELRGTNIEVAPLAGCSRCTGRRWFTDAVKAAVSGPDIEIDGARGIGFRLRSDRPIRLNARDYPATLELIRNGDGIAVVNELPLEDYVVGVIRAEASDRWPLEALHAQAIVARTYAAYQRGLNAAKPYHIVASSANQQYAGQVPPSSPAWDAARDTAGQVMLWEGQLFPAFYHSESGGYTEDPRTVFAARNMPGLVPVRCPFSTSSPFYYWNVDLRVSDLSDMLRKGDVAVGTVTAIDVSERTPSLRASVVTIHGSRGSVRLRGNDFRRIVGYDTLKSTLFAVAIDGSMARFAGRGYGHGVGMCQWGAKGMADQGYQARQILAFYYRGATLGFLDAR
jgi:stage II sporulation protein D